MPSFEHEYIVLTDYGPFGFGDLEKRTHFYFGYHLHFRLPGTVAIWAWLAPLLMVTTCAASFFGTSLILRLNKVQKKSIRVRLFAWLKQSNKSND